MRQAYLKLGLVNKGDKTYHRAYQAFLKRLIKARKDAGLLQAGVSARMGKARSFISKCELGERRVDVIELQKLARIYDKSIAYFLGEE
jgi:transcriptional regulator with XRE-family HTH domain